MNSILHTTVISRVIERFCRDGERRTEALRDLLLLQEKGADIKTIEQLASEIPALPVSLQCKWATMFADRLFETVPEEQIAELCSDDEHNRAALAMVFLLFMESERMEKQRAEDIKALKKKALLIYPA